ncbi:MAG: hypothetical protein L6416_00475 [Candidatus Omnitrophica bacterium]|nr:hypothetical protein [Candidatus Omnitrophota bacterium]
MEYLTKRIVCLANSRKPGGRCVAGKELSSTGGIGQWIRPVSKREGQEISSKERQYENGGYAKLLDIIEIPIIRHCRTGFQTENILINDEYYWQKVGRIGIEELCNYCDSDTEILAYINDSTRHGINDRVSESEAANLSHSLCFVSIDSLSIIVQDEGFGAPKKKVRAEFEINKNTYSIIVTDTVIESRFKQEEDGYKQNFSNQIFMCISLALPFKDTGHCYRLVASIINLP